MWRNIIMICGLLLLVGGMYYAYGGLKHSVPKRMTVVEFAADERSPGAVQLSDARLNLLKAVVVTEGETGKIKKLYVPIESIGYIQEGKVNLLLDTSDTDLLQIASELYNMSKEEQMKHAVHHRHTLLREIELTGMMLDKASMRASRLREIEAVVPNLAGNFFVLRHHAKVNLLRSLVISVLGLFILTFGLFREKKAETPPPSETETT
ncbi:MAG: hypothetical protein SD837_09690 [Candidatus Electrothrix scaldis]|nr:MAG: hypothetical protein SD837_09690 [Candidatus Electrothrix sp. GW3-3]